MLFAVLLALGYGLGRFVFNKVGRLPQTGNSSLFSKNDIDASSLKLNSLADTSSPQIPVLLDCSFGTQCAEKASLTPPFQWLRSYQAANLKLDARQTDNTANFDLTTLLNDLKTYQVEDFRQRIYQYGDLILTDPVKYQAFTPAYLDITNKLIEDGVSSPATELTFYSADKPPTDIFRQGSPYTPGSIQISVGAMSNAADAIALANAYKLTNNQNYINGMNGYLNLARGLQFEDQPASTNGSDLFNRSSCYSIQADTRAYQVTGNNDYLQSVKEMVMGPGMIGTITADFKTNSGYFNTPMQILPCLEAFGILADKDPIYAQMYNRFDLYLIKNFVGSNIGSKGLIVLENGQVDINSSAWYLTIKIDRYLNGK